MQQLIDNGFTHIGEWRTPGCKVHRASWIRRMPGIYVFVVNDSISYVGMTKLLHRRLRNYTKRCFGQPPKRLHRECHKEIIKKVTAGQAVAVWAKVVDGEDETRRELEVELIRKFSPCWNHHRKGSYPNCY